MGNRFSSSIVNVAIAAAVAAAAVSMLPTGASAQAPASAGASLKTPWGEPDLQGIWTEEYDTPLQRPARVANQEFFTEAQRQELDKQRAVHFGEDPRQERGSATRRRRRLQHVLPDIKRAGPRTSMIIDPPNGRMPPQTPEAQRAAAADRQFYLALLQATDTCKNKEPVCAGGKYDPAISPRFAESPPRYHAGNVARLNRSDGPEDDGLADRCLRSGLPEFGSAFGGSFRRIVQTPGGISIFYDVNQGQGWQRNIVMNGSPHLPAGLYQWFGDSRGHWEGDTLVVDVTNFSPKTEVFGSRENLHLVERWRRTGPEYSFLRGDDRRSDRVDPAVVHQAGLHPPERRGEPDLLRAALHRGKFRPARAAARTARRRARVCRGARPRSANQGRRRRGAVRCDRSVELALTHRARRMG